MLHRRARLLTRIVKLINYHFKVQIFAGCHCAFFVALVIVYNFQFRAAEELYIRIEFIKMMHLPHTRQVRQKSITNADVMTSMQNYEANLLIGHAKYNRRNGKLRRGKLSFTMSSNFFQKA